MTESTPTEWTQNGNGCSERMHRCFAAVFTYVRTSVQTLENCMITITFEKEVFFKLSLLSKTIQFDKSEV